MLSSRLGQLVLLFLFVSVVLSCDYDRPFANGIDSVPRNFFHKRADSPADFNYDRSDTEHGVSGWYHLNGTCGGASQSPINIHSESAVYTPLSALTVNYGVVNNGVIFRNKYNVQYDIPVSAAAQKISGGPMEGSYSLLQFHFHASSEHHLDGFEGRAEAHFVHLSDNPAWQDPSHPKRLVVVGVLVEEGEQGTVDNAFWTHIAAGIMNLNNFGDRQAVPSVDFSKAFDSGKMLSDYFTYSGSLTAPPCDQTVTWIVLKEIQYLSGRQMQELIRANPTSNRPVQSQNSRSVRTTVRGGTTGSPCATGNCGGGSTVNINFAGILSGR